MVAAGLLHLQVVWLEGVPGGRRADAVTPHGAVDCDQLSPLLPNAALVADKQQ